MSDEPAVSNSEICSIASCGISTRSSAALARLDDDTDGAVSILCSLGASRSLLGPADVLSGIETTVQRIAELSFSGSMTVNTCVPSGSSGFLDIDRDIKQRREALTHEPAQLSTHENGYWDDFLRRSSRWSRARSLGLGSFLHADIGYQSRLRCRGCFIAVNRAAIARLSGEPDAVFGFETKRCELVISIGTTSWRAMMTRVPRFGRCQSRHRYY